MTIQAMYPGTFDPLTYGHLDIIIRAHKIFDKIFLAVAENSQKHPLFSLEERVIFAKQATATLDHVTVFGFNDLTINVMKKKQVNILIRGLRTRSDFEYEIQLAKINNYFSHEVETIFMISTDIWACLSSKLVKEIAQYGGRIDRFIPNFIAEKVIEKLRNTEKKRKNISFL
ncbi:pantetheine-phosphate adenylyltransferase [Candidatus Blochmanniella camponoti]|uniref:Phosphopantetheine adenylyltransferase n=1 Tax=Candidatus Blochmanniella camponoti TaxID=108080 RepID=A0AAE9IBA1_9ENTR|nr:pantetheine-phosphate adenylyltransferase [Candidatus Blochmannia herculeanus]URJ24431.1 pantetheine-phosphate adenylyltransferase [Candidatus Blochmannia herculeanus]URJ26960.1 pantetheine-phosphate adenylyltransferase [Candidatus Blochmannia herculeanus]URJ27786.1 pantetheine-phosphate adenylyltransferase [Candidatus Blochmannia herculeanus]